MIVYSEEDITTPKHPVSFRCPKPCNERWSVIEHMIEHAQEGHPDLYFNLGPEVEE